MSEPVQVPATKFDYLNLTPGPAQWKERSDSRKSSSDTHTQAMAYAFVHTCFTHTGKKKIK